MSKAHTPKFFQVFNHDSLRFPEGECCKCQPGSSESCVKVQPPRKLKTFKVLRCPCQGGNQIDGRESAGRPDWQFKPGSRWKSEYQEPHGLSVSPQGRVIRTVVAGL